MCVLPLGLGRMVWVMTWLSAVAGRHLIDALGPFPVWCLFCVSSQSKHFLVLYNYHNLQEETNICNSCAAGDKGSIYRGQQRNKTNNYSGSLCLIWGKILSHHKTGDCFIPKGVMRTPQPGCCRYRAIPSSCQACSQSDPTGRAFWQWCPWR